MDRDSYLRRKVAESEPARTRLARQMEQIRKNVDRSSLDVAMVQEAVEVEDRVLTLDPELEHRREETREDFRAERTVPLDGA